MNRKLYPSVTLSIQDDEDIIFVEYAPNIEVNLELAKEIVSNRLDFAGEKMHYLILDVSNVKSITSDARTYLLDPNTGTKNILGAAFLASNLVSALFANFFIKSRKGFPTKFFHKKNDALKWIKEIKEK